MKAPMRKQGENAASIRNNPAPLSMRPGFTPGSRLGAFMSKGCRTEALLDKKVCRCSVLVSVPTILRISGYRIGFFQADLVEPPHVHVRRQSGEAKFWLDTLEVAVSRGFQRHEIREIARILEDHKDDLMAAWRAEETKRGDGSGKNSNG